MEPVVDWPSRELSQRLAEWRLCTPHDVARCRSTVKRLSRDLPAFDSVWIDALSQSRLLTPYQSKILDSPHPDRLRIGSHVLIERLEEGAWRSVYRARPIDSTEPLLLTVMTPHPDACAGMAGRVAGMVECLRGMAEGTLVVPRSISVDHGRVVVASADVTGTSLRELLVRRGRFPGDVVLAIARELVAALAVLEDREIPHGDLRLRNVRLTERGEVRLLQTGLMAAVEPELVMASMVPLDACDGMAPELSRGASRASSQTDRYALGCLLWQLLAGRPPFPTGDPLARMTCHQTRRVPQIRELAPDVPRLLAELVTALTQPEPGNRPPGFRSILAILGSGRGSDRRRLARFATSFQGNAPRQTAEVPSTSPRILSTLTTAAVLAAVSFFLYRSGVPTELLRLGEAAPTPVAAKGSDSPTESPPAKANNAASAPSRSPAVAPEKSQPPVKTAPLPRGVTALPKADAEGVVWLTSGATYAARDFIERGPLTIRATAGKLGRILIGGGPWKLQAETVRLDNVELVMSAGGSGADAPGVQVQSRTCEAWHSSFRGGSPESALRVEWRPTHPSTAPLSSVTFEDCLLVNATIDLPVRPAEVRLANCLHTGPAPCIRLGDAGRAHQTVALALTQSTFRDSGPIVAFRPGTTAAGLRMSVVTNSCVLNPAASRPLLEFAAKPPADWPRTIELSGTGSIVGANTPLIGVAQEAAGGFSLNAQQLDADGLVAGSLEYSGSDPSRPDDSQLRSTDAVRSAQGLPGIRADRLP
jgi:serine/threonine protein kinase